MDEILRLSHTIEVESTSESVNLNARFTLSMSDRSELSMTIIDPDCEMISFVARGRLKTEPLHQVISVLQAQSFSNIIIKLPSHSKASNIHSPSVTYVTITVGGHKARLVRAVGLHSLPRRCVVQVDPEVANSLPPQPVYSDITLDTIVVKAPLRRLSLLLQLRSRPAGWMITRIVEAPKSEERIATPRVVMGPTLSALSHVPGVKYLAPEPHVEGRDETLHEMAVRSRAVSRRRAAALSRDQSE
eukprot:gnl/Dysnectes_brevis/6071_a9137_348.p1 GENE.gnl/Dysnectes_brevis/6071_a9137_348~~gnl/Dysnectes_brevis/6071_a9137_348.p1  ORF type:complete len:245 (-),score=46.16 gnl/Dysnectes_brevis/6071_a9137_348:22-756(-)